MALGRFMSGLAIAALVAAAPVTAQVTASAPQPKVEQVSAEASMRGSNRLVGLVGGGLIIAAILIVLLKNKRQSRALPPRPSP